MGALRQISDKRQMAHNKNTDSVSFLASLYVSMDTTQNAKPVMHATGGKRLYQWMGHAFVCLLGSLIITQGLFSLNKTLFDSAATNQIQPIFSPKKLL